MYLSNVHYILNILYKLITKCNLSFTYNIEQNDSTIFIS